MARKIQYRFNPFDLADISRRGVPKSTQRAIEAEVKDFVLKSVLSDVGGSKSPVSSSSGGASLGSFKGLTSAYRKEKKKQGGSGKADLELSGDMLDSLKIVTKKNTLVLGVGAAQQGKADGHNNFSGKSPLPERKFIPDGKGGEGFRQGIVDGITAIVREGVEEDGES